MSAQDARTDISGKRAENMAVEAPSELLFGLKVAELPTRSHQRCLCENYLSNSGPVEYYQSRFAS